MVSRAAGPTYRQILRFASSRPMWQQDLMRRIAVNGSLSSDDLAAAVQMCKAAHGLGEDTECSPIPISRHHVPDTNTHADVSLLAIRELSGVNALIEGQALNLAESGMTTVFGSNGAGKSGYARVLKRLCRARGSAKPILPNVFESKAGEPSGTIEYSVGSADRRHWTGSLAETENDAPEELGQISVFDSQAGRAVVEKAQSIEYVPPGLDLLHGLTGALDHVREALRVEAGQDQRSPAFPSLEPETKAGAFLASISSSTQQQQIDQIACWSAEDEEALQRLHQEIAQQQAADPKIRLAKLRAKAERYENMASHLETLAEGLGDDSVVALRKMVETHQAAVDAQKIVSERVFAGETLPGTGREVWKLLWEAARRYSTEAAYPSIDYPNLGRDARCVLCQQDLDDPAKQRLRAFEDFVSDEAAKVAENARNVLASQTEAWKGLIPRTSGQDAFLTELGAEAPEVRDGLVEFVDKAEQRKSAVLAVLAGNAPWEAVVRLPLNPASILRQHAESARAQIQEILSVSATDVLAELGKQRNELQARKALAEARLLLMTEVARLKRERQRDQALKGGTSTSRISSEVGKITSTVVTAALESAFNSELESLSGKGLRVKLSKSTTRKGVPHAALMLQSTGKGHPPIDVLSEGEQRAVALAAFFAELEISPSRSAIVFDDPVTSLDHDRRRGVAQRLAREALRRQVIVLTHDTVFQILLTEACGEAGAELKGLHVQRLGSQPGHCSEDPPWDTKTVKQRVGALKVLHGGLEKVRKSGTDESYRSEVVHFYDRLRKTWERAVEECLLNKCIQRFGHSVQTQRLRAVDILEEDYTRLEDGMSACSAWVHDRANPLADPSPEPDEVARDLNKLIDWILAIRARRPGSAIPGLKRLNIE